MQSPFLKDVSRDMRLRGYALKTEKTYIHWILRYIHFINRRHSADAGSAEVTAFLTWLAADRHVSVNTQKIALNALVYLYHKFLARELGELGFRLATKQRQLPTVLSVDEVRQILRQLEGRNRLIIQLLYGSGLRISECLRLRVKDIDFDLMSVTVHDGKGKKDRKSLLSASVVPALKHQIEVGLTALRADNLNGVGPSIPTALARKYPTAFSPAQISEPSRSFLVTMI